MFANNNMGFERFKIQYEFSVPGSKQMLDSDLNGMYGVIKDPRTTMKTDLYPVAQIDQTDPEETQGMIAVITEPEEVTREAPVYVDTSATAVMPVAPVFLDESAGIRNTEIIPVAQTEQ
jgi:hypothetical protein